MLPLGTLLTIVDFAFALLLTFREPFSVSTHAGSASAAPASSHSSRQTLASEYPILFIGMSPLFCTMALLYIIRAKFANELFFALHFQVFSRLFLYDLL